MHSLVGRNYVYAVNCSAISLGKFGGIFCLTGENIAILREISNRHELDLGTQQHKTGYRNTATLDTGYGDTVTLDNCIQGYITLDWILGHSNTRVRIWDHSNTTQLDTETQ